MAFSRRRSYNGHTQVSCMQPRSAGKPATEEDDKLLQRGVTAERLEQLQNGDTVVLGTRSSR